MNITSITTRRQETQPEDALISAPLSAPDKFSARSYNLHDDRFANIGYHEAVENGANPDTYQLMLRHVLRSVEVENHDARDLSRREAGELQQDLASLAAEEAKLKQETLPALQEEYRRVEERYNEVLHDPAQLAAGELAHDNTKLKVTQAGVLALSGFLYIFYFIVGHAAFVRNIGKGLEAADAGSVAVLFESVFDASAVIRDFIDMPFNLLICALFPTVFMVIGYLFHEFRANGRAGMAWGCLAVIAGLDCTMAYKVSAKMHEARFLSGLSDETWRFAMIFSDVTFYMILLAGMAVYLLWGALLGLYFEEKRQADRVAMFLAGGRETMAAVRARISAAEAQLAAIGRAIQEKRLRSAQLDEPGIMTVFPWHRIEQVMDSFTAGWARGIAAHYKGIQERLAEEEKVRSNELPVLLEGCKAAVRQAVEAQRTPATARG